MDDALNARNPEQWSPSAATVWLLNAFGVLLLFVGLLAHQILWAGPQSSFEFSVGGADLLIVLALTVALLVLHEAIHGVVIGGFGGTPKFGVTMIGKALPALYCTSPGTLFSRVQYFAVAVAPFAILGVACAIVVALVPYGGWLVVPAAVHLSGCVGDLALMWVALRQPKGTRIEDLQTGLRIHR